MSVANLKNVFSNQGAAPLKAPGTSFLHGNKAHGSGPVPSNGNPESKVSGRWGINNNASNNNNSSIHSIGNNVANGFGNSESKIPNGVKTSTPHPTLEKRQSSEHFGVTLKRVSLGDSNSSDNNRSFLHTNGPTSPPVSNTPDNTRGFLHTNGPKSPPVHKTPASPPTSSKPTLFKVADNTKFAKAQHEKSPSLPSSTEFTPRKLNAERTVSDSSPLTNGFHGATPNKSNLFGSVVKPATSPGVKTFSRPNLNKVNSTDETDALKTNAVSPPSRFGQTTSPSNIANGTKSAPKAEVVESKMIASKTIGAALSPRPKPVEVKFSPSSPALPAKPAPQIARKGSDAAAANVSADRMRLKFEDSEKKRKALIGENQKVQRDLAELDKKFEMLKRDHDNTKKELAKKDQQLNHLRNLSEGVYKEYDQLKHQHEMEIGTMRKAMDRASRWYKENKELKRKSSVLIQRVKQEVPHLHHSDDELDSATGSGDDQDSETQDLRNTVSDLTCEVSRLQSSLNTAKQREFEAQESVVELQTTLDEQKRARQKAEFSLKELQAKHANLDKVSRLVAAEVQNLNDKFERERKQSQAIRQQADQAKKERNVLAHQSQLLMLEAMADERFMQLLTEIESLKSQLEDQENRHDTELRMLQDKLDDRETEPYVEILEEKLKVVENELSIASEKCERAEQRIEELEAGGGGFDGSALAPRPPGPPPPPPPPGNMPPPPPPPPLPSGPAMASGPGLNLKGVTLKRRESTAVMDMANLLGINTKDKANGKPTPQGGAIDDIINQLKEGKFTLKPAEKKTQPKDELKEEPAPMKELMNVLGTLKKRPKRRDSEANITADSA